METDHLAVARCAGQFHFGCSKKSYLGCVWSKEISVAKCYGCDVTDNI